MFFLLVVNFFLIAAVLMFAWWALGLVANRRRVGLEALARRLSLECIPECRRSWFSGCFNPVRLRGVYRGHEILVEQKSQWMSGRLKYLDVLHFACDYPGAPDFELIPVSPLAYWVRVVNPRLVQTGDAAFDRLFALKTRAPAFILEVLDTPIRRRLLDTFAKNRARGSIRFCDGVLTYAESRPRWSQDAVDRFEQAAKRFYELSLAVKVFTVED